MTDPLNMLITAATFIDSDTKPTPPIPGSLEDLRTNLSIKVYQLLNTKPTIYLLRALTFYKQFMDSQPESPATDVPATTHALSAAILGACKPFLRCGVSLTALTAAAGVPLTETIGPLHTFITKLERSSTAAQGNVLCEVRHYDTQLGSVWRHLVKCEESLGLLKHLSEASGIEDPEELKLRTELCWMAFLVAQRENRELVRSTADGSKYLLAGAAYYFLYGRDGARCIQQIQGLNEGSLSLTRRQSYQTCQGFDPLVQNFFNDERKMRGTLRELLDNLSETYQKRMPRDIDERECLLSPDIIGPLSLVPSITAVEYNTAPQYQAADVTSSGYLLCSPVSSPLGINSTPRPAHHSANIAVTPARIRFSQTPQLAMPPSTPARSHGVGAGNGGSGSGTGPGTSQAAPPGTPGRAVFAGVMWLTEFVNQNQPNQLNQQQQQQQNQQQQYKRGWLDGPGTVLRSLVEIYGAEERLDELERLVRRLVRENPRCERMCRPDAKYSKIGEQSKEYALRAVLGVDSKPRLEIAERIFYYLFDSLLSREFYVQEEKEAASATNKGENKSEDEKMAAMAKRLVSVLSKDLLVRSILAFAVETVGSAVMATDAAFPAVLECFDVTPFEFFRISMNIHALGVTLPGSIAAHFCAADEMIVDISSWERGSRVLEFYEAATPTEIVNIALSVRPLPQQENTSIMELLNNNNNIFDNKEHNNKEQINKHDQGNIEKDPMHHGFYVLIRKFFSVMGHKLEKFCSMSRMKRVIEYRAWLVFVLAVAGRKSLLSHRQGTLLLLCAIFACLDAAAASPAQSQSAQTAAAAEEEEAKGEQPSKDGDAATALQKIAEMFRIPRTVYENVEIGTEPQGKCALPEFYTKVFAPATKGFVDAAAARFPVVQQSFEDELKLPRQMYATPLLKRGGTGISAQQGPDAPGSVTWKTPWPSCKRPSSSSFPSISNVSPMLRTQRFVYQNTPMKSSHQVLGSVKLEKQSLPQPQLVQQQQQQQQQVRSVPAVANSAPLATKMGTEGANLGVKRAATPPKREDDNYIGLFSPTPNKKRMLSKNGRVEKCGPGVNIVVPTNKDDPLLLNGKREDAVC